MSNPPSAFAQLVQQVKGRINEVPAGRMPDILHGDPNALLIDTREHDEFIAGHVRGAVWLGKGIIERDIEAKVPDRERPLFLYCGGGSRSALAAENLQKMGYNKVYSVDGGWRALKSLLPTE